MKLLVVFFASMQICEMPRKSLSSFIFSYKFHPARKCSSECFLNRPNQARSTSAHPLMNATSDKCDSTKATAKTQSTIIANKTFRIPSDQQIKTISRHQVQHPLTPSQTFCISKNLCNHCYPQSFGFHPTAGSKLSSGLFRLSCPLLVQAIDDWEAGGGVREMSDWLRKNGARTRHTNDHDGNNWKQKGYQDANEVQKMIRQELVSPDDKKRLVEKLGEYNANKFMESGVAGIPPEQTFDVKCIHAHVADHLCRVSSDSNNDSALNAVLHGDGNIIGKRALELLHKKGVPIVGNDVCWQQCSGSEGWRYVAKKNRRGLKSTRLRRKELRNS
jgi:hypothetical protein